MYERQNRATSSVVYKFMAFLLAFALAITFLPGGLLQPWEAKAETKDVSQGAVVIPAGSADYIIKGTTDNNNYRVLVEPGYFGTLTLDGLDISSNGTYAPIRIKGTYGASNNAVLSNVNIVLKGANRLVNTHTNIPALQVDQGTQINISAYDPTDNGSGSLYAQSSTYATVASYPTNTYVTGDAAAIGAPNAGTQSTTTDAGGQGTVSSYANASGAAVNTTVNTAGGNVTITSGTVTAMGGDHGAGIGGGHTTFFTGKILITGGVVKSHAGYHAAGIGAGCPNNAGNTGVYAFGSTIVAIPPAEITSTTSRAGTKGLGGADDVLYIGDPNSPLIKVRTSTSEAGATIYFDIDNNPLIKQTVEALLPAGSVDLTKVKFGTTQADGYFSIRGSFTDACLIFTDFSSSAAGYEGRPFLSVTEKPQTWLTDANSVVLPVLDLKISIEDIPSKMLKVGYTQAQAKENAHRVRIAYGDTTPLTDLTFKLQGDTATNFSALQFYKADGVTGISAPTTLNAGDEFIVVIPIQQGKAVNVYDDTLLIAGKFEELGVQKETGDIRRVIAQTVGMDDTGINANIQVDAAPKTYAYKSSTALTDKVELRLSVSHSGLPVSITYDPDNVRAYYIITTQAKYEDITEPLSQWRKLNPGATTSAAGLTDAYFSSGGAALPDGTYYIHWYVESGVVFAHSEDYAEPLKTNGAFGPYVIDSTAPTATMSSSGGKNAAGYYNGTVTVTIDFNKELKTTLALADLTTTAGTLSNLQQLSATQYTVDVALPDNASGNITVKLPAGIAVDLYGNAMAAEASTTFGYQRNYSLTITPAQNFGDITYRTAQTNALTFTVTNNGDAPLTNVILAPSGANGSYLRLNGGTNSITIAALAVGESQTFTVQAAGTGALQVGAHSFDVRATQANGASYTASIGLTVTKITENSDVSNITVTASPASGSKISTNQLAPNIFANSVALTATLPDPSTETINSISHYISTNGSLTASAITGWTAGSTASFTGDGTYTVYWKVDTTNRTVYSASGDLFVYGVDITRPTVTSITTTETYIGSAPVTVTIKFSEALAHNDTINLVPSFTGGLNVTNGTVTGGPTRVSATEYTVEITANTGLSATDTVDVSVPAGVAFDLYNNPNTASAVSLKNGDNGTGLIPTTTAPSIAYSFTNGQAYTVAPTGFSVTITENGRTGTGLYTSRTGGAFALSTGNLATYFSITSTEPSWNMATGITGVSMVNNGDKTHTITFTGSFTSGNYTVTALGGKVFNYDGNALDASSRSFSVAVPKITGIVIEETAPAAGTPGGSATLSTNMGGTVRVTLTGEYFENAGSITLQQAIGGVTTDCALVRLGSGTGSTATYTGTLPRNYTTADHTYTYTAALTNKAGGSVAETYPTTVTAIVPAGTATVTAGGMTATPASLAYTGGQTRLEVSGSNLHNYTSLQIRELLGGTPTGNVYYITGIAQGAVSVGYTVTLPLNTAADPAVYTFQLYNGATNLGEAVDCTVAAATPSLSSNAFSASPTSLTSAGGSVTFTVKGVNLQNFVPMTISDGVGVDIPVLLADISLDRTTARVSYTLPANTALNPHVYDFTLHTTTGGTSAPTSHTATVTVAGNQPVVTGVSANPRKLDSMGGSSTITVNGSKLDICNPALELIDSSGLPTMLMSLTPTQAVFTTSVYPANMTSPNDVYTLEAWLGTDGSTLVATGRKVTVQVGDSLPTYLSLTASPNAIGLDQTKPSGGRSTITIDGYYLYNFGSIVLKEPITGQSYNVSVSAANDGAVTQSVYLPSNEGIFTFELYIDGVLRDTVDIAVGVGLDYDPGAEGDLTDPAPKDPGDKRWTGRGGGHKGLGFTGKYTGFDFLYHHCKQAVIKNPDNAVVTLQDIWYITQTQLDYASVGAREANNRRGGRVELRFDTVDTNDKGVLEGRLIIDPFQATTDLYPVVCTCLSETARTRSLFTGRYGATKLAVICLSQNGAYGTEVEIMANVDLDGMNTDNLYFYHYDRETGAYNRMDDPDYSIDRDGFLHFYTEDGGDIIVTDSPLTDNGAAVTTGSFPVDRKEEEKVELVKFK